MSISMKRPVIPAKPLLLCFLLIAATAASAQYAPTPEEIQRLKESIIARQQAAMRGDKDSIAQAATPPDADQPLPEPTPAPKGQSGIDYAHNPMFKKCTVTVSFGTSSGDTASNTNEKTHSGSGQSSNASMKLSMYVFSNLAGRTALAGGDGITAVAVNGMLNASGYDISPETHTSYSRAAKAVSNPLPAVAFNYDSDTSWSVSVTINYAYTSSSNPSVISDYTSVTQEADPSNATLTHKGGNFFISRKVDAHSKEETGPRKERHGENGTFTITITTDR